MSIFLTTCAESNEKTLARLEAMLAAGEKQKVILEIDTILNDLNEEQTESIRSASSPRHFVRNSSGTTVAWLEKDKVFFYNGELDSISLDENGSDLRISDNGKFALAFAVVDEQCLLFPMSLQTEELFPEIVLEKCEGRAAITDTGEIWYPMNGKIFRKKNPETDQEAEPILDKSRFSNKFKKIRNDFYIFSAPDNTLIIFYGNAGYYNLYGYDMDAGKLISAGIKPVKPIIHWVEKRDLLFPENSKNSNSQTDAYLFTGSIGKFMLSSLSLNGLKSGISFSPPPETTSFTPISDTGFFYFIDNKSRVSSFNSRKNSITMLPIKAKSLVFTERGFLYNDENNGLKLRRTHLSDFENKLLKMKQKAEEN